MYKFGLHTEQFNNFPEYDYLDPYMDPGDNFDSMKWDFPEDKLKTVYIEDYPYKIRNSKNHTKKAKQFAKLRKEIKRLCDKLEKERDLWDNRGEFTEGIKIFLDVHQEYPRSPEHVPEIFHRRVSKRKPTSRYLISEIPEKVCKGTGRCEAQDLIGLNKPKMRHLTGYHPVGPDGPMRCGYRDVFLKHDLVGNPLRDLVLHELSHTGANHCRWVDDNHGEDFQRVENLLTLLADDIGFLRGNNSI